MRRENSIAAGSILVWTVLVIAILSFIWLTPPDWIRDPTATGLGIWSWF